MSDELNVYNLSRNWFDWCFENPEKISPNHSAMYFFIIEHCNRLGWKDKFGLPTTMVKDAIGIKNFRTYTNTLNDLVSWGFIKMIEKSKNQYSSNIIAIVKNTKASTKALDKALQKHSQKHCKSIVSIDKQDTIIQDTILPLDIPVRNLSQVDLFLTTIPEDWFTPVSLWLKYKKEKKQEYKSQTSLDMMFNKLKKLSENNVSDAIEMVEDAISKNYAGFFKLTKSNGTKENFRTDEKPYSVAGNVRVINASQD